MLTESGVVSRLVKRFSVVLAATTMYSSLPSLASTRPSHCTTAILERGCTRGRDALPSGKQAPWVLFSTIRNSRAAAGLNECRRSAFLFLFQCLFRFHSASVHFVYTTLVILEPL